MRRVLVAVALLAACRGERAKRKPDDAGPVATRDGSASVGAVVPALPRSDDGTAAMRALDASLDLAMTAGDRARTLPLLLERAWIRGRLDDYQRALTESERLVTERPAQADAWRLRIEALLRVHEVDKAKVALATLGKLVDANEIAEQQAAIDQASGNLDAALVYRAARAQADPHAQTITLHAATLAEAGRTDEALALVPQAAAKLRNNTPQYFAWLLFQWGRIHELAGQHAAARDLFEAAHARLPAYVEATEHLAEMMMQTGRDDDASKLVEAALVDSTHPALRTLAHRLRVPGAPDTRAITTDWERYVAALPLAFADHAARAFHALGIEHERALQLATQSFEARRTPQTRVLVLELALASPSREDGARQACAYAEPFVKAGTRNQQFLAWQALARCGRTAEAQQLANTLGIGTSRQ